MTINHEARVQFCEERIAALAADTEGCDLFTVLGVIWDAEDSGEPFYEWFERSRTAKDILRMTQSNPNRSWNRIHRMGVLEERQMEYQEIIDQV